MTTTILFLLLVAIMTMTTLMMGRVDCSIQSVQLRPNLNSEGDGFTLSSSYFLEVNGHIPDTSVIPLSSPFPGRVISKTCIIGLWALYHEADFKSFATLWEMRSLAHTVDCDTGFEFDFDTYRSIRFVGPSDTAVRNLRLFSQVDFQGDEIVLDDSVPAEYDFAFPIKSWFLTGSARWRLYQEAHFNGTYDVASTVGSAPTLTIAYKKNVTQPIRSVYMDNFA